MIRVGLVGIFIVLAAASAVARHQPIQHGVQGSSAVGVYKEFIAFPADHRRAQFAAMSPENKASVMRTHMERWIQANKRWDIMTDMWPEVYEEVRRQTDLDWVLLPGVALLGGGVD